MSRREADRAWAAIAELAALARAKADDHNLGSGEVPAGGTSLFRFAQALKAWRWTPARPNGQQVTQYLIAQYALVRHREDPPADAVFEQLELTGMSGDPLTEFAHNFDAVRVPAGAQLLARAAAHGVAHPVTLAGATRSRGYRQFLGFVCQLQRMLPETSLGLGVARVATVLGVSPKTVGLYLFTAQQDGVLRKVESHSWARRTVAQYIVDVSQFDARGRQWVRPKTSPFDSLVSPDSPDLGDSPDFGESTDIGVSLSNRESDPPPSSSQPAPRYRTGRSRRSQG